ncbi:DNA helicase [Tanacetum coccineum]
MLQYPLTMAQIRNEKSSGSGVCGSVLPFISSISQPCKAVVCGGYRTTQNNHSVGDKVVVMDFGNSEVRFDSCESFFGVTHSKGYRHSAYEFPNDSSLYGSYIRRGPMVLDFKNYVIRSVGAENDLPRTDAHKSTPSTGFKVSGSYSVGDQCQDYFRQCGIVCSPGECSSGGTSGTRTCTPVSLPTEENGRDVNVRRGQLQSQTDIVPFDSCIDRHGLDVICKKKQKRTRSFSFGSSHHEASDAMNHGGVTGLYIDIEGGSSQLDPEFVSTLIRLLDEHNELVRLFRTAMHKVESDDVSEFRVRLFSVVGAREYDLPTSGTLGAIVFENGPNARTDYDVIIESRGGFPHRNDIRREYLSGIHDAISRGDREGNPQYFVTFTCNVNWPEIKRYMLQFSELTPADRADIVVRVFEQKVQDFCKFLKDRQLFGSVTRQLPNPDTDPEGYRVVSEMMVHGLCGLFHSDAVCMKEGKCGKNFPIFFIANTLFDADGYVHYRRRETHICTTRRGVDLDNAYIVPYNRQLCLAFHAYINVESIMVGVGDPPADTNNGSIQIDEIQNYIDGRFVCPHEACWRILKYDIHGRQPAVQILSVHLEGMQPVTFRDHQPLTLIVNDEGKTKTMLTEWLEYNKLNGDGLHLSYIDFTKEFVWYSDTKSWRWRQRRNAGLIGRLANVHPTFGELFFLRMLLCHQKGCKTFDDIRTVNKRLHPTFRAACEALGLLGDDKEWHTELEEVAFSASGQQLRSLIV